MATTQWLQRDPDLSSLSAKGVACETNSGDRKEGSVGIYGIGNPVRLPSPKPYPTCVLTNPNFWCRIFQVLRTSNETTLAPEQVFILARVPPLLENSYPNKQTLFLQLVVYNYFSYCISAPYVKLQYSYNTFKFIYNLG